ncbi:Maf/Ham1 [Cladorrhinum samala]|uniref:inosine/xanthosine triphosphatase n=1 Tax=Cladorrhinum samala TaxID=585594 RepID=A0AAV9HBR1_9PEZI|nr:Maf/Ham1 [Cladorrhinum samala]
MGSEETGGAVPPAQSIVVSSKNPVKLGAALDGFANMFSKDGSRFTVKGVSVASGVPEQPMTDDETLQGALNRVQNAREAEPEADYWVGIEGGVNPHRGSLESFAWVVVTDKTGRTGKARTAAFYLPEEVAKLVRDGMELGPADDLVFGRQNSKQKNGAVGLLTDDAVTRKDIYVQAVTMALIPFKNLNLTF